LASSCRQAAAGWQLDANPDHVEALSTFAELCSEEGDWSAASKPTFAWSGTCRAAAKPKSIGAWVSSTDTALPNPERAELAYREY